MRLCYGTLYPGRHAVTSSGAIGCDSASACRVPRRLAATTGRTYDLRVQLLQAAELLHPLLQRQAVDGRHLHRPVDPVRCTAALEVEIPARLPQSRVVPALREFAVDRFQGEACC